MRSHQLELLSPARDADIGIAAIDHGADAVYIGGPSFGARDKAGNSLADIDRLVRYAHRFDARIFVTLNTILRDDELDEARRMAWQLYEADADALIVQAMGYVKNVTAHYRQQFDAILEAQAGGSEPPHPSLRRGSSGRTRHAFVPDPDRTFNRGPPIISSMAARPTSVPSTSSSAAAFDAKHSVKVIEAAYESQQELGDVSLMITRHCVRWLLSLCPKQAKGVTGVQGTVRAEPLTLIHGTDTLTLRFDCKPCEMHVVGRIRPNVLKDTRRALLETPMQFYRSATRPRSS